MNPLTLEETQQQIELLNLIYNALTAYRMYINEPRQAQLLNEVLERLWVQRRQLEEYARILH